MNMASNHDLNSWEGTEFERAGKFAPAFAVLSYTLPGMPPDIHGSGSRPRPRSGILRQGHAPAWEPRNDYFAFYQKLNALKHSRREAGCRRKRRQDALHQNRQCRPHRLQARARQQRHFVAANLQQPRRPRALPQMQARLQKNAVNALTGEAVTAAPAQLAPGEYIVVTYDID